MYYCILDFILQLLTEEFQSLSSSQNCSRFCSALVEREIDITYWAAPYPDPMDKQATSVQGTWASIHLM